MTMQDTHVDRAARFEEATESLEIPAQELAGVPRTLVEAAEEAALDTAIGTIAFAGQRSTGTYAVQFNQQGGNGYSSTWPEWAFELAKEALLHGKRVWVGSNGSPFGSNLTFVHLLP